MDIAPRLVDAAAVEVEVLSDVAVVVEDSSLDEQLPNILWHLLRSVSARSRAELKKPRSAMPSGLTTCSPGEKTKAMPLLSAQCQIKQ
jgi:hypothetical protein